MYLRQLQQAKQLCFCAPAATFQLLGAHYLELLVRLI